MHPSATLLKGGAGEIRAPGAAERHWERYQQASGRRLVACCEYRSTRGITASASGHSLPSVTLAPVLRDAVDPVCPAFLSACSYPVCLLFAAVLAPHFVGTVWAFSSRLGPPLRTSKAPLFCFCGQFFSRNYEPRGGGEDSSFHLHHGVRQDLLRPVSPPRHMLNDLGCSACDCSGSSRLRARSGCKTGRAVDGTPRVCLCWSSTCSTTPLLAGACRRACEAAGGFEDLAMTPQMRRSRVAGRRATAFFASAAEAAPVWQAGAALRWPCAGRGARGPCSARRMRRVATPRGGPLIESVCAQRRHTGCMTA